MIGYPSVCNLWPVGPFIHLWGWDDAGAVLPRALVEEEELLGGEAASVAGERAGRADHAVAGDDDGDGIRRVRPAGGAGRGRVAGAGGELAVVDGRAERERAERGPHLLLPRRPPRPQRQRELPPRAAEVLVELPADVG